MTDTAQPGQMGQTREIRAMERDGCHVEGAASFGKGCGCTNWADDTTLAPDRRLPADDNCQDLLIRLREAERRAQQNERLAAIGEMVVAVAHESRNSLQKIQGAVESLQQDLADSPGYLKELARVHRATDNIRDLLEELRSYAAPINLERELADVSEVWRYAWGELAEPRSAKNRQLSEHACECNLICMIDAFRLEQVFRNLFDNAIAACSKVVPQIEVHCTQTDELGQECLRISVCDNGPGINDFHREKTFQPFFTTKQRGTGLGMSIVRRIIESHGGIVTLGPNRNPGAEVILTIPRGISS